MSKEIFIVRNRISLAAVHSHPFLKISPENTGSRVLLLVKLLTDCSEWRLYTKMAPPRIFSWKSSERFRL